MQRRFEIVDRSYCTAIHPVKEARIGSAHNQTSVTRVSVKKLKLPKRARILPQHPKSSELLDRSRRFSPAGHLLSTTSRRPVLSCGYQAQQTLGNKLRPKSKRGRIPNRVETSRQSTAVTRGCGDDKVLSPHPIGHRPALLPVHLQTGSCLLTTVSRLFESRQTWDCWGHPNEPEPEPQSAPRLFPVGSQPFSQVPPSKISLLVAAACPTCQREPCLVGLCYLPGRVAPTVKYAIPITLCSHPLYACPYRPLTLPIAHYYIRAWHARMVVASGVDETVFPIVVQRIVSVPLTCHPDFLSPFLSRHSLPMCPPGPIPLRLAQAPKRRVKSQGRRLCRFLVQIRK